MSYVLESRKEFERLERQSQNPAYDFRRELAELSVKDGNRILDAGCGSGLITRYLAERYPSAKVEGCDLSQERVKQAQAAGPGIQFHHCDLGSTPFGDNTFDMIVSRYVFQHLAQRKAGAALRELFRILKPQGKLLLVDGDGLFVNLYPQTKNVERALEKIVKAQLVDFRVGRKLPYRMAGAGFDAIQWNLLTASHEGQARETEVQLMRERFELAAPMFEKLLGRAEARRFARDYLENLAAPTSTYFTETFVITGTKPGHLRLIKPDRKEK